MKSDSVDIPKINFYNSPVGHDRSLKLSFLNTKLYDTRTKQDIEVESKVPIPYISDSGNSTVCYPISIVSDPTKFYRFPHATEDKTLLPFALHAQGYQDENCQIPNHHSNLYIFNEWLRKGFDYSSTTLSFAQVLHPDVHGSEETRILWTAQKLNFGETCFDDSSCSSGNCDGSSRACGN